MKRRDAVVAAIEQVGYKTAVPVLADLASRLFQQRRRECVLCVGVHLPQAMACGERHQVGRADAQGRSASEYVQGRRKRRPDACRPYHRSFTTSTAGGGRGSVSIYQHRPTTEHDGQGRRIRQTVQSRRVVDHKPRDAPLGLVATIKGRDNLPSESVQWPFSAISVWTTRPTPRGCETSQRLSCWLLSRIAARQLRPIPITSIAGTTKTRYTIVLPN